MHTMRKAQPVSNPFAQPDPHQGDPNNSFGYPGHSQSPQQHSGFGYGQQPNAQPPANYHANQHGMTPQYGAAPQYGSAPYHGAQPKQKSRIIALLLCFFLGSLGVHNFYYGQTKVGINKLILLVVGSILTAIFIGVFLLIALYIWILIDFILIAAGGGYMATDSDGVPTKW